MINLIIFKVDFFPRVSVSRTVAAMDPQEVSTSNLLSKNLIRFNDFIRKPYNIRWYLNDDMTGLTSPQTCFHFSNSWQVSHKAGSPHIIAKWVDTHQQMVHYKKQLKKGLASRILWDGDIETWTSLSIWHGDDQVWAGPLEGEAWVVVVLNRSLSKIIKDLCLIKFAQSYFWQWQMLQEFERL